MKIKKYCIKGIGVYIACLLMLSGCARLGQSQSLATAEVQSITDNLESETTISELQSKNSQQLIWRKN